MKTPHKKLKFCFASLVFLSLPYFNVNNQSSSVCSINIESNPKIAAVFEYIYQQPKGRNVDWVRDSIFLNIIKNIKESIQTIPTNEVNKKSERNTIA